MSCSQTYGQMKKAASSIFNFNKWFFPIVKFVGVFRKTKAIYIDLFFAVWINKRYILSFVVFKIYVLFESFCRVLSAIICDYTINEKFVNCLQVLVCQFQRNSIFEDPIIWCVNRQNSNFTCVNSERTMNQNLFKEASAKLKCIRKVSYTIF